MFWNCVIVFCLLWIVQSFFMFINGKTLNNEVDKLGKQGLVLAGKPRGFCFLNKSEVVLAAVSEENKIKKATALEGGGVFRRYRPCVVPQLEGIDLNKTTEKKLIADGIEKKYIEGILMISKNSKKYIAKYY